MKARSLFHPFSSAAAASGLHTVESGIFPVQTELLPQLGFDLFKYFILISASGKGKTTWGFGDTKVHTLGNSDSNVYNEFYHRYMAHKRPQIAIPSLFHSSYM